MDARPSPALPTLRVAARPTPLLALDAQLPLAPAARVVLSLESPLLHDAPRIRVALESHRLPFLRLHLTPVPAVSLRLAPLRLASLDFLVLGFSLPLLPPTPPTTTTTSTTTTTDTTSHPHMQWLARTRPILELTRRHTLLSVFFHTPHRSTLLSTLLSDHSHPLPQRVVERRQHLLNALGVDALLPQNADPRNRQQQPTHEALRRVLRAHMDKTRAARAQRERPATPPPPTAQYWPGASRDDTDSAILPALPPEARRDALLNPPTTSNNPQSQAQSSSSSPHAHHPHHNHNPTLNHPEDTSTTTKDNLNHYPPSQSPSPRPDAASPVLGRMTVAPDGSFVRVPDDYVENRGLAWHAAQLWSDITAPLRRLVSRPPPSSSSPPGSRQTDILDMLKKRTLRRPFN